MPGSPTFESCFFALYAPAAPARRGPWPESSALPPPPWRVVLVFASIPLPPLPELQRGHLHLRAPRVREGHSGLLRSLKSESPRLLFFSGFQVEKCKQQIPSLLGCSGGRKKHVHGNRDREWKAHYSLPTLPTSGVTGALAEPQTPSTQTPKRQEKRAQVAALLLLH